MFLQNYNKVEQTLCAFRQTLCVFEETLLILP